MTLSPATPELPVKSVTGAQQAYHDAFGFDIAWHDTGGRIGAVSRGECNLFFRETTGPIHPATLWIYCETLEDTYATMQRSGATITDPLATKPWGLRQFTVTDANGHQLHFHYDG